MKNATTSAHFTIGCRFRETSVIVECALYYLSSANTQDTFCKPHFVCGILFGFDDEQP